MAGGLLGLVCLAAGRAAAQEPAVSPAPPLATRAESAAPAAASVPLATPVPPPAQPDPAAALADLDALVARELAAWKVPGVGLAILKDGRPLLVRGYGFRDVDKRLPVTAQTRFAIASNTKSFTAATVALLVDEGKLAWDKPVRTYLPDFQLQDLFASEHITPRDLLCHDSGLPRHDFVWYGAKLSREDLIHRLRYLEPSKDFRSTWQYNNLMFAAAGFLAGKAAGTPWETLVHDRLFVPLGMTRSNFLPGALDPGDTDFALPFSKDHQEKVNAIPFYADDPALGPAGMIYSTAEDLSHWVAMKLAHGQYAGRQVLTAAQIDTMQTPQMPMPSAHLDPELGDSTYGLGVILSTFRGHRVVLHGGNINGFSSQVTFLPDDRIGVVTLANLDNSPFPNVLAREIFDRLLGLPPIDWSGRTRRRTDEAKAAEEGARQENLSPRKPDTHPAHPLDDYVGTYTHPAYGTVEIARAGNGLEMRSHGCKIALRHFHYEVFDTPEESGNALEKGKVMFHTNWNGEVDSVSSALEPQVADIVFTRQAGAEMRKKEFLDPMVGKYALGPVTVSVTLRDDDTLLLAAPGEDTVELVPAHGATFTFKGLSGYSAEFRRGPDGAYDEMAVYQPDGNFVAKRVP